MRIISCKKLLTENLGRMNSLKNSLINRANDMGQQTGTDRMGSALDKINNPANYVSPTGGNNTNTNNTSFNPMTIRGCFSSTPQDAIAGTPNKNKIVGVFGYMQTGDTVHLKDTLGNQMSFKIRTNLNNSGNKDLNKGNGYEVDTTSFRTSGHFILGKMSNTLNTFGNLTPGDRYLYLDEFKRANTGNNQPRP
jgi:hypothetical protein